MCHPEDCVAVVKPGKTAAQLLIVGLKGKVCEDEPDNVADLALGENRLLPRLCLSRQLGCFQFLPRTFAPQGRACERGRLLSVWIQSGQVIWPILLFFYSK